MAAASALLRYSLVTCSLYCCVDSETKIPHQKMNVSCCVNTVLRCQIWWVTLTCTHSFFVPRLVRAVVTVQSLVVVARVCLIAHLAHLLGAGLAAVTAIHEEAHTRRTGRGDPRTLTGPLAVLCPVVRVCSCGCDGCGRQHGSGILGVGLERWKPELSLKDLNTSCCFFLNTWSWVQHDVQPIFIGFSLQYSPLPSHYAIHSSLDHHEWTFIILSIQC